MWTYLKNCKYQPIKNTLLQYNDIHTVFINIIQYIQGAPEKERT